ncbi:hypothetical protein [Dyella silvatica]|uniref:hypothetical protein n=1 Tax=Dyella silvatica TaxID=2992128 RepID=UPI00225B95BD|nr:hypothetical protein [Dyella silvatica]
MRLLSLVSVSIFTLLPVLANAGEWPAGQRSKFVDTCVNAAKSTKVDPATAKTSCECNAGVIDKTFTTKEIEMFNAGTATPAMTNRMLSGISVACKPKK